MLFVRSGVSHWGNNIIIPAAADNGICGADSLCRCWGVARYMLWRLARMFGKTSSKQLNGLPLPLQLLRLFSLVPLHLLYTLWLDTIRHSSMMNRNSLIMTIVVSVFFPEFEFDARNNNLKNRRQYTFKKIYYS